MKYIKKYLYSAVVCALTSYSFHTHSLSIATTIAWLKSTLGYSATSKKISPDNKVTGVISFENDFLDAIEMYELAQLCRHWAVKALGSSVQSSNPEDQTTKSYPPGHEDHNVFDHLEFYEQVIQTLELDNDGTYTEACEKLLDILQTKPKRSDIYHTKRNTIITLFNLSAVTEESITVDHIEHKPEYEHIKTILHHAVLLTSLFDKIAKNKLISLCKTITIKVNDIEIPHNYITQIPLTEETCTVSLTLPVETFAQLLDVQELRGILSDDPLQNDNPCLAEIQQFLKEHPWIRAAIKHLQQNDSMWNSVIANYINMQVVFTYTFDIKEFESGTIRINYLLVSQLNKWTHNPPTLTTRYRPFQTIEITVNNN